MPLRECIAAHTHREYLAWLAWLKEEWNQPSRTDHYLMRVAAEVRHVNSKTSPKSLKPYRINFELVEAALQEKDSNQQPGQINEAQMRADKLRWSQVAKAAGGKVRWQEKPK